MPFTKNKKNKKINEEGAQNPEKLQGGLTGL